MTGQVSKIDHLMIDDAKPIDILHPIQGVKLCKTYREGRRILRDNIPIGSLYLDYYLDDRKTGMQLLQALKYFQMPLPERIVFISSEREYNERMAMFAINDLGMVLSTPTVPVSRVPAMTVIRKLENEIPADPSTYPKIC